MSKYGNKITEVDGIRFHSAAEARRYQDLRLMEYAGEITKLQLQPKFPIVVNGMKICTYVADFRYQTRDPGRETFVVEDVKGVKTRDYRIKKKLVKALYGVEIVEVEAA